MTAEVKFTMSVPALDALRRIVQRDFLRDVEENKRIMQLPAAERSEPLRQLMRNESERGIVERTLGFDGAQDEIGKKA
jgi:hypothetical protein